MISRSMSLTGNSPVQDPSTPLNGTETLPTASAKSDVTRPPTAIADADGYLLEADFSEEAVQVIAAAEGITLTEDHWKVVNYLRDEFGHLIRDNYNVFVKFSYWWRL